MPYQSTDQLPEQTRNLTDTEKRAFMKAFNSAVSDGKEEQSAFRIAWKAAKQSGERSEDETTEKSMTEFRAVGEISKVDDDKRQVFGWASVIDVDGQEIVDKQNDWMAAEDLEKAAYDYVMSSRIGGTMHQREVDKSKPKATSTMIESFVVTPEKIAKMGLPPGSLPLGWWTGFQINDEQTWNQVKKGKLGSFSIHGSGRRTPAEVSKAEKLEGNPPTLNKGELAENLTRVWHLSDRDPVTFTKAVAVVADAAYARGLPSAAFYGQVVKHLIGSHDQQSHARSEHGQSEKATAAGLTSGGFGAAVGGVLGGLATRSGSGAAIGSAIGGGSLGGAGWLGTKLKPGQEASDLEGAAREMDETGNKEEADRLRREAKRKREESQETSKHLIGSHEQKDHAPNKGDGHSRSQHEGLTRQYHGLPNKPHGEDSVIGAGTKEFGVSEQELAEMFHASGATDLDDLRAWKKNKKAKKSEPTSKRLQEHDKQVLAKYLLE